MDQMSVVLVFYKTLFLQPIDLVSSAQAQPYEVVDSDHDDDTDVHVRWTKQRSGYWSCSFCTFDNNEKDSIFKCASCGFRQKDINREFTLKPVKNEKCGIPGCNEKSLTKDGT